MLALLCLCAPLVTTASLDLFVQAFENCTTIALLFADQTYADLANDVVQEWLHVERRAQHAACVALIGTNTPSVCTGNRDVLCVEGAESGGEWGTDNYFTFIDRRLPFLRRLHHALPLDSRRGILLLDADVHIRRAIGARFSRCMLSAQQEVPCSSKHACINGGLYRLALTAAARHFLDDAIHFAQTLRIPDQDALQLATRKLERAEWHDSFVDHTICHAPADIYVNGITLQSGGAVGVHTAHVNWVRGFECKKNLLAALRKGGWRNESCFISSKSKYE